MLEIGESTCEKWWLFLIQPGQNAGNWGFNLAKLMDFLIQPGKNGGCLRAEAQREYDFPTKRLAGAKRREWGNRMIITYYYYFLWIIPPFPTFSTTKNIGDSTPGNLATWQKCWIFDPTRPKMWWI